MDKRFWTEMILAAVIAFTATYAGVYWSFSRQLDRAEADEKAQFGRLLQGVLAESANNYAILSNVRSTARVGSTFAFEVRTDAIQVALGSPLFHRYADYSLIYAAYMVRTQGDDEQYSFSISAGDRERKRDYRPWSKRSSDPSGDLSGGHSCDAGSPGRDHAEVRCSGRSR